MSVITLQGCEQIQKSPQTEILRPAGVSVGQWFKLQMKTGSWLCLPGLLSQNFVFTHCWKGVFVLAKLPPCCFSPSPAGLSCVVLRWPAWRSEPSGRSAPPLWSERCRGLHRCHTSFKQTITPHYKDRVQEMNLWTFTPMIHLSDSKRTGSGRISGWISLLSSNTRWTPWISSNMFKHQRVVSIWPEYYCWFKVLFNPRNYPQEQRTLWGTMCSSTAGTRL